MGEILSDEPAAHEPLQANWNDKKKITNKERDQKTKVYRNYSGFQLYLTIDNPLGQKRIVTRRPNWSKPRWANLVFQLIHTEKLCKPSVSLFFLKKGKPERVFSHKRSLFQNSTVATVTIKYTASYTKNLHQQYGHQHDIQIYM